MIEKGKKKWLVIILAFVILAVILNAAEQVVIWQGLELRILAEELKGIFLWLIMPYVLVFSVYMLARKKDQSSLAKKIILGIACFLILVAAFFRGILYIFGDGDRSEKTLDTGAIAVTYYGYNDSYTRYYVPVALFCKKPFEGWRDEEILFKIQQRYGDDVIQTAVDSQDACSMSKNVEGAGNIVFEVRKDAALKDNYEEMLYRKYAEDYWSSKERWYYSNECSYQTANNDYNQDVAVIVLEGREDIKDCAEDIADWISYVKENEIEKNFISQDAPVYQVYVNFMPFEEVDSISIKALLEQEESGTETYLAEKLQEYFDAAEKYKDQTADDAGESGEESGEQNGERESEKESGEQSELSIENVDVENLGEEYALDEQQIFRLVIIDAALGSRAYALIASADGGNTWEVVNADPFNGTMGVSAGLKFMDENIGFAALSHNGGDEADLYRTEDGGKTFTEVVIPSGEREDFSDGSSYFPFDFPGMPYEENGSYYLKAGQGADGDFNGGDAACRGLYQSTDMGKTWSYVEITEP